MLSRIPLSNWKGSSTSSSTRCKVSWTAPSVGIKLNIDGSFHNQTKMGGAGGVFRNSAGDWLSSFSASINVNSAYKAKAMDLLLGLKMALKKLQQPNNSH